MLRARRDEAKLMREVEAATKAKRVESYWEDERLWGDDPPDAEYWGSSDGMVKIFMDLGRLEWRNRRREEKRVERVKRRK